MPLADFQANDVGADRTHMPELSTIHAGRFPEVQRSRLPNGLEIILARRSDAPTVVVDLLFEAGYAEDGSKPGLASLTMSMLDEGTRSMSSLEINEQLQLLGASIGCAASLDHGFVRLKALKQSLQKSMFLLGEILVHPSFPQNELDRLIREQLAAIQREKVSPMPMALRVLPKLLYGPGHRYAQPLTGSGYTSTISQITRDDVLKYYSDWIRPNNAKLMIVGDVTMEEAKGLVESSLSEWVPGPTPERPAAVFVTHAVDTLYLLDRPDAQQSIVIGGYLVDAYEESVAIATEHMNDILGGQFISRINMNLREDKHWTYGARSIILDTQGQRPLLSFASVQQDKTLESIIEIRREFQEFTQERPVTQAEFDKNQNNAILALPGQWETNAAVADSLMSLIKLGLPDDYFQTYPNRLRSLALPEVHEASRRFVRPDALCWLVVGDQEKIMPALSQAGFSNIVHIDGEGNVIDIPSVT